MLEKGLMCLWTAPKTWYLCFSFFKRGLCGFTWLRFWVLSQSKNLFHTAILKDSNKFLLPKLPSGLTTWVRRVIQVYRKSGPMLKSDFYNFTADSHVCRKKSNSILLSNVRMGNIRAMWPDKITLRGDKKRFYCLAIKRKEKNQM